MAACKTIHMMNKVHSYLLLLLFSLLPLTAQAGDVYFYHTDNFGTPMAMTDQTGEVVWRADELPFGEEYETEEIPQQNNRRFLGKELDKETGLVYMGARYLDPKTGRFTQPDPVGIVDPFNHGKINQVMLENPQRQNRYVYGLNNPYKYIDPDGNSARDIEDHINPYEAVLEGGGGRGGSGYSHGGSAGKSIFSSKRSASKSAVSEANGRTGKQARLKELGKDPTVSSADRGWIKQDINQIKRGTRKNVRVPPGKNLAHRRGFEAKKGYGYEHSDLQDIDLHKLQHKHEGY